MILWSSRKLEEALAKGWLSGWTKVKYLIIPAVITALWGPFFLLEPRYGQRPSAINLPFQLIFSILSAFITYWGIKKCFTINSNADGKDFFERLAVLTLPVLIRIMVYSVAFFILGAVILKIMEWELFTFEIAPSIFSALNPIFTFILYSMLINSFRRFGQWNIYNTNSETKQKDYLNSFGAMRDEQQ